MRTYLMSLIEPSKLQKTIAMTTSRLTIKNAIPPKSVFLTIQSHSFSERLLLTGVGATLGVDSKTE